MGGQGRVSVLAAVMLSCEVIDSDRMAEGCIRISTNPYYLVLEGSEVVLYTPKLR